MPERFYAVRHKIWLHSHITHIQDVHNIAGPMVPNACPKQGLIQRDRVLFSDYRSVFKPPRMDVNTTLLYSSCLRSQLFYLRKASATISLLYLRVNSIILYKLRYYSINVTLIVILGIFLRKLSLLLFQIGDFGLAKKELFDDSSTPTSPTEVTPSNLSDQMNSTNHPTLQRKPSQHTSGVGTQAYAAPEQLTKGQVRVNNPSYKINSKYSCKTFFLINTHLVGITVVVDLGELQPWVLNIVSHFLQSATSLLSILHINANPVIWVVRYQG